MNWEAVSGIGEVVGATAVVVSLIYLAFQVRQNTSITRASVRHAVTERAMAGASPFVASEKLSRLLQRSIDGEKLVGHERLRLAGWVYMNMRNWENMHYQHLSGMLSENEWNAFRKNLRFLFQVPAFQESWELEQEMYTDVFRREADDLRSNRVGTEESMLTQHSEAELSAAAGEPEQ